MASIEDICNEWLLDLANDMRASIKTAISPKSGESELEESVKPNLKMLSNGNIVLTLAMNDYWQYVDKGRGATKRGGSKPGKVRKGINRDWYTKNNIDPRTIMIEINRKAGLKMPKKGLSYDKASRALSFLIARKIHKEGIKPRPFFDKVFNEARVEDLKNRLAPAMKETFIIELRKQ